MTYQDQYSVLIQQAKDNPPDVGATHHILPKSIHRRTPTTMPRDHPDNLIFLSHQDHLQAHWLLYKMYRGTTHGGLMAAAFCFMIGVWMVKLQPTQQQLDDYADAMESRYLPGGKKLPIVNVMTGEIYPTAKEAGVDIGITAAGVIVGLKRAFNSSFNPPTDGLANLQYQSVKINGGEVDNFSFDRDLLKNIDNLTMKTSVTKAMRIPNKFLIMGKVKGVFDKEYFIRQLETIKNGLTNGFFYSFPGKIEQTESAIACIDKASEFINNYSQQETV